MDCVKAACAAAACVALGREVTAACFDGLMRSYAEARCLDLTGVGGQLLLGVGSQLSEGALAELGALCPDAQAVFCPREVRSCFTVSSHCLARKRHSPPVVALI